MRKNSILRKHWALCLICILLLFTSCNTADLYEYYSDRENYISATGVLTYIDSSDEFAALYLGFSDLSPSFDDTCFKIVGDSFASVTKRNIEDKLKVGDKVEFVSAPRYFGDGYVMPIVSISVNGETLLDFEEGLADLLSWLKSK